MWTPAALPPRLPQRLGLWLAVRDGMQQTLRQPATALSAIVLKRGFGRLGNRLYRFGNVLAFAREHGLKAVDLSFGEDGYLEKFERLASLAACEYPLPEEGAELDPGRIRRQLMGTNVSYVENLDARYDLDYEREAAKGKDILWLDGFHFQADELVDRHRAEIQAFFAPARSVADRVEAAFRSLRSQHGRIVGVHIRQTDFATWNDGSCYFEVPDYVAVLLQLQEQLASENPLFLLFSDGPLSDEPFAGLPVLFSNGDAMEDMHSLSRCDLIVGAPSSTFSGWSSFYGDKPLYTLKGPEQQVSLHEFSVKRHLSNLS